MVATVLLVLASLALARGVLRGDEGALMLGVTAYTAVTFAFAALAPEFFIPAIMLAIALASLGLIRFIAIRRFGDEPH